MKAFLFDLNGTMIDDMGYHVKAWYTILNDLGAGISMERAKEECYGKNHELLERVFPGRFSFEEKTSMSYAKEEQYQREFKPNLQLIHGLHEFLAQAHRNGIKMAIGSAAITFNIDFVLDGLNIRHYFDAIISADHVDKSKPDPETYLKCAAALGVPPADCIVFEDVPKGVESAANAGMRSVVITTMHTEEEFSAYKNIIGFVEDYTAPWLQDLLK
jgi:HAD superfamily hydrolase (TIGR01509 family)